VTAALTAGVRQMFDASETAHGSPAMSQGLSLGHGPDRTRLSRSAAARRARSRSRASA
jgi:hypothetical protein